MASFAVLALAASTVALARPFEGPALTLAEKRNNDKQSEVSYGAGWDQYTQQYSQYGAKDTTKECVVPHTDGQDDTPHLLAAYADCNKDAKIVFAANTTYNIVRASSLPSLACSLADPPFPERSGRRSSWPTCRTFTSPSRATSTSPKTAS